MARNLYGCWAGYIYSFSFMGLLKNNEIGIAGTKTRPDKGRCSLCHLGLI